MQTATTIRLLRNHTFGPFGEWARLLGELADTPDTEIDAALGGCVGRCAGCNGSLRQCRYARGPQ